MYKAIILSVEETFLLQLSLEQIIDLISVRIRPMLDVQIQILTNKLVDLLQLTVVYLLRMNREVLGKD